MTKQNKIMKTMEFHLHKDQNKTAEDVKWWLGRFYVDCSGKMDQVCLYAAFTATIFVNFAI